MLCCNVVTNAQLVHSFQTSWDLFPAVLAERCISGEPVLLCQDLSADSAYICTLDVESKRGFRNVTTASHYLEMLKAEYCVKEVECTLDGLHFNRVHRS